MSPKEAADILAEFNDWRRGRGKYAWSEDPHEFLACPYTPGEIGEAIDIVSNYVKEKEKHEDSGI